MGIHETITQQQLAAMEETISGADILLNGDVRRGYPGAILLFSFIDAVGALHGYDEGKKRFRVLRDAIFEGQKISISQCDEMYSRYRSGLTHNLSLPGGSFLTYSKAEPYVFKMLPFKGLISEVNLYQLHKLCVSALGQLRDTHTTLSEDARSTENLLLKSIDSTITPESTIEPSGHCDSIK